MDWEAELGVVIGRGGRHLAVEDALDAVFGYVAANDVSARSLDLGYERDTDDSAVKFFDWLEGKWCDGFAPMGPWILTADEVPDPQALGVRLTLNGEVRQSGSTADMIFTVAELVAFASRLMTLEPGDVLLTGTPAGVGAASGRFLTAGDEMTVSVDGLGSLTTKVA
jgi:2-keto-4-pentenoate hydratase/2-oxohepta-3-ene-1,7-dioic acid hydratase in catechol pathway